MTRDTENLRHFDRACDVIPKGLKSNFRKNDEVPRYFREGRGARLVDLDGNEHIDYSLSYGPSILGHSDEALRSALHAAIDFSYTNENCMLEAEAAELICETIPCAEQAFFCCTGTDAVANAHRVARAYTGRNFVVRFKGHYNGWHDALMGGIVTDPEFPMASAGRTPEDKFSQQTDTAGRGFHGLMDTFLIEWNDLPALTALLERTGEHIAAVHMEPIMMNYFGCWPQPGYLEGVRELCTQYGVLLIFDEVITGYRIGLHGAQGVFKVTPDLTTLGKAIGGGVPVAALCGRRDVLHKIATFEAICGGTYNGHPLATAAVATTLTELKRDDGAAFRRINELGTRLATGLRDVFGAAKLPLILQGFPGAWYVGRSPVGTIVNHADAVKQDSHHPLVDQFSSGMRRHGVLMTGRFYTSAAHTEADVDATLELASAVCQSLSAE
jgi:glutamate-1-semialdehyde 2,1-aminomutase